MYLTEQLISFLYFIGMGCANQIIAEIDAALEDDDQRDRHNHSSQINYVNTNQISNAQYQNKVVNYKKLAPKGGSSQSNLPSFETQKSFLTQYLYYQKTLNPNVNAGNIRLRQIMQHEMILSTVSHDRFVNFMVLYITWVQMTFTQIIQTADKQFFKQNKSYEDVIFKIGESFLYQLERLQNMVRSIFIQLGNDIDFMMIKASTDQALYPILKAFKQKYPMVSSKGNTKYPQVKTFKKQFNLLDNIDTSIYSDPDNLNYNLIFKDLKKLIDISLQQVDDFKQDMRDLLGPQVLANSKVSYIQKNGIKSYKASTIRRIFIKWTQIILQKYPDIIYRDEFAKFLRKRMDWIPRFHLNPGEQTDPMHFSIIQTCMQLLYISIFQSKNKKNPIFGFFIYDLLRCKITKKNSKDIIVLLEKMQKTNITKSGKKFQITRIKNRFNTPCKDLFINYKYGDVLIGEAQLCLDDGQLSLIDKKNNKFNHYFYQLQRGIFGPMITLMIHYQDAKRQNLEVSLFMSGNLKARKNQQKKTQIKKTSKVRFFYQKCSSKHDLFYFQKNYFTQDQSYICQWCFQQRQYKTGMYFCFYCFTSFCSICQFKDKEQIPSNSILDTFQQIKSQNLRSEIEKQNGGLLLVYDPHSSCSNLTKNFLLICNKIFQSHINAKLTVLVFSYLQNLQFCQQYNINAYPTVILYNKKLQPQKGNIPLLVILGLSICYPDILLFSIAFQKDNQVMRLIKPCPSCKTQMVEYDQSAQFVCNFCQRNQADIIAINKNSMVCTKCNVSLCQYCGFGGFSKYEYITPLKASSYKITDKKTPNQMVKITNQYCNEGKQFIFSQQNKQNKQIYNCFNCHKNYYFIQEFGYGYCNSCKNNICYNCIGTSGSTFQQAQGQVISHKLRDNAPHIAPCACGKHYFFTFNSTNQQDSFKCLFCQKTYHQTFHLGCFNCKQDICENCVNIFGLMQVYNNKKIEQGQTQFSCPQNKVHKLRQLGIYSLKTLDILACFNCKRHFYPNTPHFACIECNIHFCKRCSNQFILNNPPKPLCSQLHQLTKFKCYFDQGYTCQKCNNSYAYGSQMWRCLLCSRRGKGYCNNCLSVKFKEKKKLQPKCSQNHKMIKKFQNPYWEFQIQCNQCGLQANLPVWHCQLCYQDICTNCCP